MPVQERRIRGVVIDTHRLADTVQDQGCHLVCAHKILLQSRTSGYGNRGTHEQRRLLQINNSSADSGVARVGVRAGKSQCAVAGLGQSARAGQPSAQCDVVRRIGNIGRFENGVAGQRDGCGR